ncbi:MAG: hypothetical protein M3452_08595 [Chloroflexota bacterium]|nr:hypothetical protein [Chloroflexota bacterium]
MRRRLSRRAGRVGFGRRRHRRCRGRRGASRPSAPQRGHARRRRHRGRRRLLSPGRRRGCRIGPQPRTAPRRRCQDPRPSTRRDTRCGGGTRGHWPVASWRSRASHIGAWLSGRWPHRPEPR